MENNNTTAAGSKLNQGPPKQVPLSFKEKIKSFWLTSRYPKKKVFISVFVLLFFMASIVLGFYLAKNLLKTKMGTGEPELSLTSTNAKPKVGDKITVAVHIDTKGMQVSATDIKINFDSNILTATSVQNGGFMPTVLAPGSVSDNTASIVLGCLIDPNRTYPKSGKGILVNINFTVKSSGTTTVSFGTGTGVAVVGQTSNAIGTITPIQIKVQGQSISPTSTPVVTQAGQFDVIDFMRANFNYNGFTQLNSYLALNGHTYDSVSGTWTHITELPTCPPELDTCVATNWHSREMIRQKPGENILYLSKYAFPGKSDEVFWFNNSSVYDFQEPNAESRADFDDTSVYGLFHFYYHLPADNPGMDFPNRGIFWSTRYFTSGENPPVTFSSIKTEDFRNMVYQRSWDGPAKGSVRLIYYPSWDSSLDTWNKKPDTGNLPIPLQVVVDVQTNTSPPFTEKYFYARNGSNSFGMIRYENWAPKASVCGSNSSCCTQTSCDGDLALINYNTYNVLSHYDTGEDPNAFFNPSFYSDPKLEAYPGTPSNGALPRGAFQLSGSGLTTDGKTLTKGSWVQLTEILTDGDWMISSSCPDGYQSFGSIITSFYDHKNVDKGTGRAVFCGINKNVILATSCPTNYISRGWFDAPTPTKSAYDYKGKDISGKRVNYCVAYNEFHYPKTAVAPTPTTSSWFGQPFFESISQFVRRFVSVFTIPKQ